MLNQLFKKKKDSNDEFTHKDNRPCNYFVF